MDVLDDISIAHYIFRSARRARAVVKQCAPAVIRGWGIPVWVLRPTAACGAGASPVLARLRVASPSRDLAAPKTRKNKEQQQ
jgi:hypothetical protein